MSERLRTDERAPRWSADFPVRWEDDQYITRRELAKFLTLGSALLVGANALVALVGRLRRPPPAPRLSLPQARSLSAGEALLFRYPSAQDPCILLRGTDGRLRAYSQVCTHLSCAIVYRPERDCLFCPCHNGVFSTAEGLPMAGPPTRRLPRIRLAEDGRDVWAVGVDV
jgi:Rieske Fe-S protein